MDELSKLESRKAALKAQIEQQRTDLKKTFLEVREEVEPANLLKKAVNGFFDSSKNGGSAPKTGIFGGLPAPLGFVADLLIRDPKWAFLIKLLAPVVMRFLPKIGAAKTETAEVALEKVEKVPVKTKIYGGLRRGVSSLRGHLKKGKKDEKGGKVEEVEKATENENENLMPLTG